MNRKISQKNILLIEENEIISDDHKVAEIFSKYVCQVDIPEYIPSEQGLPSN